MRGREWDVREREIKRDGVVRGRNWDGRGELEKTAKDGGVKRRERERCNRVS